MSDLFHKLSNLWSLCVFNDIWWSGVYIVTQTLHNTIKSQSRNPKQSLSSVKYNCQKVTNVKCNYYPINRCSSRFHFISIFFLSSPLSTTTKRLIVYTTFGFVYGWRKTTQRNVMSWYVSFRSFLLHVKWNFSYT